MIVFGLLASVSPLAIMVLVSLMLTKKPMKNALSFLAGFTMILVALGAVAVFVLHVGTSKAGHTADAWIDIGLGIICLALIPVSMRKKKEKPQKNKARPLSPAKAFSIGMVTMCINASTIVIYVAGAHAVTEAHVGAAQDAVALVVLTLFTLSTLLLPMAIYAVFPKKSDRLLAALRVWLVKHQKAIGVGLLIIFGVYLLAKGINTLV
jgi:threonine/homoserine/homoserine lactone efflux protein